MRRALVLLILGAPLVASCRPSGRQEAPPPPDHAPASVEAGAPEGAELRERAEPPGDRTVTSLLYATFDSAARIWQRDLEPAGKPRQLLRASAGAQVGVLAALRSTMLQAVTDDRPDVALHTWAASPHLRLYGTDGRVLADRPSADLAAVSPDGRLAWLEPVGVRACDPDDPRCDVRTSRVVVASRGASDASSLAKVDGATAVAWSAGRVLVDRQRQPAVLVDARDSSIRQIATNARLAGTASSGDLITAERDAVSVVAPDGTVRWRRRFVGWSASVWPAPTGATVVVQLGRPRHDLTAQTRLLVLDASSGRTAQIDERGADGDVVWSPDGRRFGYRRTTPDPPAFEFVLCDVRVRCRRPGFTWTDGVFPLALTIRKEVAR